jgi:hypothetical protein
VHLFTVSRAACEFLLKRPSKKSAGSISGRAIPGTYAPGDLKLRMLSQGFGKTDPSGIAKNARIARIARIEPRWEMDLLVNLPLDI